MLSGSTQRGRTASSRQPRQVPSCSSEPPGRSSAPRVQAAEAAQGGNPPRSRAPPLPPRASYRSGSPGAARRRPDPRRSGTAILVANHFNPDHTPLRPPSTPERWGKGGFRDQQKGSQRARFHQAARGLRESEPRAAGAPTPAARAASPGATSNPGFRPASGRPGGGGTLGTLCP